MVRVWLCWFVKVMVCGKFRFRVVAYDRWFVGYEEANLQWV